MRSVYIFCFLFLQLFELHSQRSFSNFLNVFSEAQRVTDSFMVFNPEVSSNFKQVDWRLTDIDHFIEVVPVKKSKQPILKIKDFKSLTDQELKLFQTLQQEFSPDLSTVDYYYSVILYWILPHSLSHQLRRPFYRKDFTNYSKFMVHKEVLIDLRTYQFILKADLIQKFPDFYTMISQIAQYTQPKNVVYIHEFYERKIPMNETIKSLHKNARTMQLALEHLVSGTEKQFLSAEPIYNENVYQSEAAEVLEYFKEKYYDKANDKWTVKIEPLEASSGPVEYDWKRNIKKYKIKSFNHLEGSEEAFLNELKERYGYKGKTIDFYYHIIQHWILPYNLVTSTFSSNEEDLQDLALSYLADNGMLKAFEDFNNLCKTIVLLVEQQRTQEQIRSWDQKPPTSGLEYSLYLYAKEMLAMIAGSSQSTSPE